MYSTQKMQDVISMLLIIGMLISVMIVAIGGTLYLLQHGNENLQTELLTAESGYHSIQQIWQIAFSFTPIGIIELGLLTLVATQILRVALLTWFYAVIRDYWFTGFSFFILVVLIYSSVLRG